MNNIPIFEEPEALVELLQVKLDQEHQIKSVSEFPDPYELHDMGKAVDIFTKAIADNDKIKFIIDSDMDGLGTYTLWYNFFMHFPYRNIEFLITDRKKGYGFIPEYIDDETKLYITSDNGITAVPATDLANCKGAKVIICDHHQPDLKVGLPMAAAIIDPYHPEDTFPYKDISGTFVLWFFIKALVEKYDIHLDVYKEFLPELALTTLSDVMPINKHMNRFVVQEFVNNFCSSDSCHREYLNTFREQVNAKPTAESFSFGLTPMINATQRITTASHGASFLVAQGKEKSLEWFEFLQKINNDRKEKQQTLQTYIEKYYLDYTKQPFIIIPGRFQKEYKGVLGIIAGRLAEEYNKPCIVLNYNAEKKEYSGSGRSIGNLDILGVLRDNPYIVNVGGHKQALGITIKEEEFQDFFLRIQEDIQKVPAEILNPPKEVMGFIPINKISIDFFDTLAKFEPFGHKFKKPVFVTKGILKSARLVGKQKNHLSTVITDTKGLIKFKGMQFFRTTVPEVNREYNFYFKLDRDDFSGTGKVQLMLTAIEEI